MLKNSEQKILEEDQKFNVLIAKIGNIKFAIETPNPTWGQGWKKVKIGGHTPIIFTSSDIH